MFFMYNYTARQPGQVLLEAVVWGTVTMPLVWGHNVSLTWWDKGG